ncbi:hypothetical protein B7463_g9429, partial [Scytalidium lignicola]
MPATIYSSIEESRAIFDLLCDLGDAVALPPAIQDIRHNVKFTSSRNLPYFPIPFKESETASALKALEGCVASALADLKGGDGPRERAITVNLENATNFLFQAYVATVGGYGKLDKGVKSMLKDTDLLQAQSDPYRRMSANLYETKDPGEYYHIHGSLEASTTLRMIGLEPFRPDLRDHPAIVETIEGAVKKFTIPQLEQLNAENRQAGIKAFKHEDFLKTPHGKANQSLPPWQITNLENVTPPSPLPNPQNKQILSGIKVLELCRIIAGPTITRILGEYGADVIKITSPTLSDVPFFQVDGNMGKHAAELDLKSAVDRKIFEKLLEGVDIIVDGYRPGAIEKLGYGVNGLTELAKRRGKGIVYVNENCFGYEGEWANRAGWQQIADCVSGVAWEQGRFMGLTEPVVPPFPISDYGTGCIGAIAALTGLYQRSTCGGSWHGKVSLLHYDLLLFKVGLLPQGIQDELRTLAGPEFLALRHSHSVDQISGTTLLNMKKQFPKLFDKRLFCEKWYSEKYNADVVVVKPVVEIEGVESGFKMGSRPNGSDIPSWDFEEEKDYRKEIAE